MTSVHWRRRAVRPSSCVRVYLSMGRTVGAGAARAAVVSSGSKFRFISGSGSLCLDFLSVSYQDYRGHSEMDMCCASCMQGTGQTCKRCLTESECQSEYKSRSPQTSLTCLVSGDITAPPVSLRVLLISPMLFLATQR